MGYHHTISINFGDSSYYTFSYATSENTPVSNITVISNRLTNSQSTYLNSDFKSEEYFLEALRQAIQNPATALVDENLLNRQIAQIITKEF